MKIIIKKKSNGIHSYLEVRLKKKDIQAEDVGIALEIQYLVEQYNKKRAREA